MQVANRTANSVDVNVQNNDSVSHTCTIHVIAMHD
jgi:hypothetical protein